MRLTSQIEKQLIILLSLVDLKDGGTAQQLLDTIQGHNYWRGQASELLTTLTEDCIKRAYVLGNKGWFTITPKGEKYLSELCELAYASRHRLKKSTSMAFLRIKHLREEIKMTPFTQKTTEWRSSAKTAAHYHVYIVLLKSDILEMEWILNINPNRKSSLPCIYVGMTGLTPEERFKNHKAGKQSSPYVQEYGICLLPNLYSHLNPMSYSEAKKVEKMLANKLRREGYTVLAGHHDWPAIARQN